MITQLVRSEIRAGWRRWFSVILVGIAASTSLTITLTILASSALHPEDEDAKAIAFVFGEMNVTTALAVAAAMAVVVNLALSQQRPIVARWMLAGVLPKQAGRIVWFQGIGFSIIGALIGIPLAAILWPVAVRMISVAFRFEDSYFTASGLLLQGLMAALVIAVAAGVGSLKVLRQTKKVSPLEAIRDTPATRKHVSIGRIVALVLTVMIAVGCLKAITITDEDEVVMVSAVFLAASMVLLVVLLLPIILRPLVRAWTAIIPASASPSWFLGKNSALHGVSYSTATIAPVVLAAGLVSLPYGMISLMGAAYTSKGITFTTAGNDYQNGVLSIGVLIIAAAAATAVVIGSAKERARENALIQAAGGTRKTIIAKATAEGLIYLVTSILLSLLIVSATAATGTWAIRQHYAPETAFIIPWLPVTLVSIIGGTLVFLSTIIPTLTTPKTSITQQLNQIA